MNRLILLLFCLGLYFNGIQTQNLCSRTLYWDDIDTSEPSLDFQTRFSTTDNQKIVVGNFFQSRTDDIILISKNDSKEKGKDRKAIMYGSCSYSFPTIWESESYDPTFKYWTADAEKDIYVPGDYDGDGIDELLCINPENGFSHLVKYITQNDYCNSSVSIGEEHWNMEWTNSGSGQIGSWILGNAHLFYSGDFDADSQDELLCINPSGSYWHLYDWSFGGWSPLAWAGPTTPFLGSIPTTSITNNLTVGKFFGSGVVQNAGDVIFTIENSTQSPGNNKVAIQALSGGTFTEVCSSHTNLSGRSNDAFTVSNNDPFFFFSGNFDEDNDDELIILDKRFMYRLLTSDLSISGSSCNFNYNGIVALTGHELPQRNPKYYEKIIQLSGNFRSPDKSSFFFFCRNKHLPYLSWEQGVTFYSPSPTDDLDWLIGTPSFDTSLEDNNFALKDEFSTYSGINVHPNPAKDRLLVTLTEGNSVADVTLILHGADGKSYPLESKRIQENQFETSLHGYSKGIYFLSVTSAKKTYTEKVIIH